MKLGALKVIASIWSEALRPDLSFDAKCIIEANLDEVGAEIDEIIYPYIQPIVVDGLEEPV
jgi:hypothetical protein